MKKLKQTMSPLKHHMHLTHVHGSIIQHKWPQHLEGCIRFVAHALLVATKSYVSG